MKDRWAFVVAEDRWDRWAFEHRWAFVVAVRPLPAQTRRGRARPALARAGDVGWRTRRRRGVACRPQSARHPPPAPRSRSPRV